MDMTILLRSALRAREVTPPLPQRGNAPFLPTLRRGASWRGFGERLGGYGITINRATKRQGTGRGRSLWTPGSGADESRTAPDPTPGRERVDYAHCAGRPAHFLRIAQHHSGLNG